MNLDHYSLTFTENSHAHYIGFHFYESDVINQLLHAIWGSFYKYFASKLSELRPK